MHPVACCPAPLPLNRPAYRRVQKCAETVQRPPARLRLMLKSREPRASPSPIGRSRWQRKHANTLWSTRCTQLQPTRRPLPLAAMQRERPFEYAATSFSVCPSPMRIRPVVIVIALVAAVAADSSTAAVVVVVAPSYC